jgi:hypothetical protein
MAGYTEGNEDLDSDDVPASSSVLAQLTTSLDFDGDVDFYDIAKFVERPGG